MSREPRKARGLSPPRVVVVGSINTDLVVRTPSLARPGETVIGREACELPGGKGANQAVAAARLGARVEFIGRVGDDERGRRLREGLEREGIGVSHLVTTSDCASGMAIVAVDDAGENSITVIPGANARLTAADVEAAEDVIGDASVLFLQLEVPLEANVAAREIARRLGVRIILDPAPARADLPEALFDVSALCPNESEAELLTGVSIASAADAERAARALCERGAECAAVTLGARGAVVCLGLARSCEHIQPFPIDAVDSTAAGDAFAAMFGLALARTGRVAYAAHEAAAAGALAASRHGAQPSMPTEEEVFRLADSRPFVEREDD